MDQKVAVARAREATGTGDSIPAEVYRVRRLDRKDEFYYLILFGKQPSTVAVATVNARTGDVENWARSPGIRPHFSIGSAEARRLAGMPETASVELVWKPCLGSRSPLYPLWEVRANGQTRHVDQQGNVKPA